MDKLKRKSDEIEKIKPVQPIDIMCWIGFGATIFGLAAICIAFASPFWIQTIPNSFNTFRNGGLWEVCFDNYMHHKDSLQEVYSGCWWVLRSESRYEKLHEWLLPPWLIATQVLVTSNLLLFIATAGTVAFAILHLCPVINHEYHQTYSLFAAAAMMFLTLISTFCGATLYGQMCQDREWMPNPQFNELSWGFGFFIISGIAAMIAGITFLFEGKRAYEELTRREILMARTIMEALGWNPEDSTPLVKYADYDDEMGDFPAPGQMFDQYDPDYGLPSKG